MSVDLEVIDFFRPTENVKNLYLTNISGKITEDELQEKLFQLFSAYGVIYEIQVFRSVNEIQSRQENDNSHDNNKPFYAFIKYFSAQSANKAKKDLTGRLVLKGDLVKIKYANRKGGPPARKSLYVSKCYELANHFLGFNGWTIKIFSLETDEDNENNLIQCLAHVRLDIVNQGLHAEGLHVCEEKWTSSDKVKKAETLCRIKKIAYQRATENAFSKVVLVVFGSGKVYVEVDTTQEETLHFEPKSLSEQMIKVNEMDEQPLCESDEDPDENLDEMNRQILLDLAQN